MRILFVLKQLGYVRHFQGVVLALAERGHAVRLAAQDGKHELPRVLSGHPRITLTECPTKRGDEWQHDASLLRRTADYARYLTPPFRGAGKLRARAFEKLVHTFAHGAREVPPTWADAGLALSEREVERVLAFVGKVERLLPADNALVDFVRSEAPDVLLVTPLIDIGSGQTDFIKAARALSVPSVMLLFSWDNLSTKGLIHECPDTVMVWNEQQKREAVTLHGVPHERIVMTGAPRFDDFFARYSSIARDELCTRLGLDAAQPMIVYLGSSNFVAADERQFIETWLAALRATPALANANVIVKPHPDLNREWGEAGERTDFVTPLGTLRLRQDRPFRDPRAVVVRTGYNAAQVLYELLFHSRAVVGLNTSAELEAAIVGRPVFTLTLPELAAGQADTLHFHYLLEEHGGFVRAAASMPEHCRQLSAALAGNDDLASRSREFIEGFLRPLGPERPPTKELVRAIERVKKRNDRQRETARLSLLAETDTDASAHEPSPADEPLPDDEAREVPTVLLDYSAAAIRLVATSRAERRWRAASCQKEPWTVRWLEEHTAADSVLYDIGANVGTFSLIAVHRAIGSRAIAFEPSYSTYAHLCDNIVLNGCQDRIVPVPTPLWSSTATVTFRYRSTEPGESRHSMRAGGLGVKASSDRYHQPVLAFRLDDLVRQFALPVPTMLKLDVDGAETHVLQGAQQTLAARSLHTLLIEFAEEQRESITGLVAAAGWHLADEVRRGKRNAPNYAEFRRS